MFYVTRYTLYVVLSVAYMLQNETLMLSQCFKKETNKHF